MLEVRDLTVRYGPVTAVDAVSLTVPDGPYGVGLVGESGSGKTTLGRAIMRLVPAAGGSIVADGVDVLRARGAELRRYRRATQIVFQDPDSTLDPRMRVGAAVAEGLNAHRVVPRETVEARVGELLVEVGLDADFARRLPHQLSGGQRQRVALARALAVEPSVLVLDEPTSALDAEHERKITDTLRALKGRRTIVVVSHRLSTVMDCDRIFVMHEGQVVEEGQHDDLVARGGRYHEMARCQLALPQPEPDFAAA
jgi:ABC-type glutathione transport system ATPase component